MENLGVDTSDGSGYPIVSGFYEKSYFLLAIRSMLIQDFRENIFATKMLLS